MKKKLVFVLLFGVFGFGVVVGDNKIFPYSYIQYAKSIIAPSQFRAVNPRNTIFEQFSPNVEFVMIGDSLTADGIWNDFFPNASIANRGIRGDITADILRRMDAILSTKPDTAFIMVGINDIYKGLSVNGIFENYVQIIDILQSDGVSVIIQSTLECGISRCQNKLTSVRQLNNLLSDYAESNDLVFVDLNDLLSDADGLMEEYTYDGIHLTGAGYREWVGLLAQHIS